MGNIINNNAMVDKASRASTGKVFYEFKRITQEELNNYRIGSYAYLC